MDETWTPEKVGQFEEVLKSRFSNTDIEYIKTSVVGKLVISHFKQRLGYTASCFFPNDGGVKNMTLGELAEETYRKVSKNG